MNSILLPCLRKESNLEFALFYSSVSPHRVRIGRLFCSFSERKGLNQKGQGKIVLHLSE